MPLTTQNTPLVMDDRHAGFTAVRLLANRETLNDTPENKSPLFTGEATAATSSAAESVVERTERGIDRLPMLASRTPGSGDVLVWASWKVWNSSKLDSDVTRSTNKGRNCRRDVCTVEDPALVQLREDGAEWLAQLLGRHSRRDDGHGVEHVCHQGIDNLHNAVNEREQCGDKGRARVPKGVLRNTIALCEAETRGGNLEIRMCLDSGRQHQGKCPWTAP
jgi:hypothetical protein